MDFAWLQAGVKVVLGTSERPLKWLGDPNGTQGFPALHNTRQRHSPSPGFKPGFESREGTLLILSFRQEGTRSLSGSARGARRSSELIIQPGNGRKPISAPPQPGCWMVAPLWPRAVQRAQRRSLSLET